jgi:hypothetical protein
MKALLALAVSGSLAAGSAVGVQDAVAREAAARALVPLLESVRERLRPRLGIGFGTLPPSPFTGTPTTLIAVRIGTETVKVDPKVVSALEQLRAWNPAAAPDGPAAILFDHWLDQLKLKASVVRDPRSAALQCDTACLIERFTRLDEAFGSSQRERQELRDRLLLDALVAAVIDLGS